MIKVWTGSAEAGMLDRHGERGSTFSYLPHTASVNAVSITMPVRLPSWEIGFGLHPIFEMNLPEGALRERLRLAFAKATGSFDEFDLLTVVGRSQVGRIRYTGVNEQLNEEVPFQSVDEILAHRRGGDLYRYLLETFASFSGVSGVQPKVLVRDEGAFTSTKGHHYRLSQSYRGATHIVKLWEPDEYPQLAANEYFCLTAARKCGLDVPPFHISGDGMALVIDRFDLHTDGTYQGVEDFCVLNARRTDEKYLGSYETAVMKRFAQFANSTRAAEDLEKLFTLIALNCALRNGDAHLKNFAVVYDDLEGAIQLAPVYDLVTTSVYIAKDGMALTLNGSTRWPTASELRRFGETRAGLTPVKAGQILECIHDALRSTAIGLAAYSKDHPEFTTIGQRMLQEWDHGANTSLRD